MEVFCSFCFANGESELQYRSHTVKNQNGIVTCPVLRSYVCPYCLQTGDHAHTQRYCPLNRDGKLSRKGATLVELKRKKNAAGNYPTLKRMTVPVHSSWRKSLSSDYFNSFSGDLMEEVEKISDVGSGLKSSKTPAPELYDIRPGHVTEPLPSGMRPATPPPVLQWQPESAQLTMYRHYQFLQYYKEKISKHQAEINRLHALRTLQAKQIALQQRQACYKRSFSSGGPMSLSSDGSPPGSVMDGCFQDCYNDKMNGAFNFGYAKEADDDALSDMLAELRDGTEEIS